MMNVDFDQHSTVLLFKNFTYRYRYCLNDWHQVFFFLVFQSCKFSTIAGRLLLFLVIKLNDIRM